MRLIVDRIEEGYAVCEREDRTRAHLPLSELPDAAEGAHYVWTGDAWKRDLDAEAAARARIQALQRALFEEE